MATQTTTAYLSLGSNLGPRAWNLQRAVFRIAERAGSVTAASSVYQTPAWGFSGADFLNACVAVDTELPPDELLGVLLGIEKELGRTRSDAAGYQSRTMDLDIIYYGREVVDHPGLRIPHPKLHARAFVLRPLADIAPQFYHPELNKDSRNLLMACRDRGQLEKTPLRLFPNPAAAFAEIGFIAIEGNIGAGKTSLAKQMAADMEAKLILERFADNPFLPKFYEDRARYAFPLEMSFLADRYQQYIDDTAQLDLFRPFMVSDYDIYKSLIFAKITLEQDEFQLYRKLFDLMYSEVRKPRLYVYLYQQTDRLLEQIANRGREYERGIPAEYLQQIHRGYFDFMKNTPELNALVLDLAELDFVKRPEDYHTILDRMLEHALKPGLNF
ncbi:2-amino-4-hydroxy-6-hydroxymethyldihydropteridine diphosphokinase [Robiginitalea sp. M366]|uniref:2-amino-4-hydroxy-6- hydroxymethyldihydropteridine diphosphokinase n=1 Tax=Robiginitalea aestuariiviva TaxID=3036903 RepID=UPI00240DF73E|nr:2-amino-4-hydroxy-6-hydroxymethyldihydropteridine diphosphokinase [Robiginitalea aestuariiviva]MDG1570958.1 2-amino-4-hydroxy-6-hydroxymethyldihydropteridine diphosphokinase [Robiginitalea aestuariiviva]